MCLNIIKAIYDKPTANIIFKSEILKTLLLRSGARQDCSLSRQLFNIVLEDLDTAISQKRKKKKEKKKSVRVMKEEVKLSLSADDIILYTEKLERLHQKIINE